MSPTPDRTRRWGGGRLALGLGLTLAGVGMPGLVNLARSAPPPPAADIGVTLALKGMGFPDGAPARVTGGFGEDSCLACHWEFDDREDTVGSLTLIGAPAIWEPGGRHVLEIEVTRPGMVVGGFQLAARFGDDGSQAGHFEIQEAEADRVGLLEEGGLLFAQHQEAGIAAGPGEDRVRWRVTWVAPEAPGGEILLHVAAVAGDGDRSQMGDWVYTHEAAVAPGAGGPES